MTIAALRRLIDEELPDVARYPAPRLNRRPLPSQERPMTAQSTAVMALHRQGLSDWQIAQKRSLPVEKVSDIIDTDRAKAAAEQQPLAQELDPAPVTVPVTGGPDVDELLAWAAEHDDATLQNQAAQVIAAIRDLRQRRRDENELARLTAEATALQQKLAKLEARKAELLPAKAKVRKAKSYEATEVRAWARRQGLSVPATGRVPATIVTAWRQRPGAGA